MNSQKNVQHQPNVSGSEYSTGPTPGLSPNQDQHIYHYHPYKKLYRSTTNKWLGGVCGGMAKYFNKDPVLIRLIWVVLTLFSAGAGIIGYILFWIFVDKEPIQYTTTNQYITREPNGSIHHHYYHRILQ